MSMSVGALVTVGESGVYTFVHLYVCSWCVCGCFHLHWGIALGNVHGSRSSCSSNVSLCSDKDQNLTVLLSQPPNCDTANFLAYR